MAEATKNPVTAADIQAALDEEEGRFSLGEAIAELQKVDKQRSSKKKLESFQEILGKLDAEDMELLLNNDQFAKEIDRLAALKEANLRPGTPIYDANGRHISDVPYTLDWCMNPENMEQVTGWTVPEHPQGQSFWEASWNGVSIVGAVGERYNGPVFFKTQVEDCIRAQREAMRNIRNTMMNSPHYAADGVSVEVGWHKASDEELLSDPRNRER